MDEKYEPNEDASAFSITEEQRIADGLRQNNLISQYLSIPLEERTELNCIFERFELGIEQPIFTIMTISTAKDNSIGAVQVGTPFFGRYGQRFYTSSNKAIHEFHSVRNKILKLYPNMKIIWEGKMNNEKLS